MVRARREENTRQEKRLEGLAVKTSGSQDILEFLMLSFRADARRTSALVTEWSQTIYESLSIHRSGVPIACSNGGSLNYRDGSSHRPGIGDHHDGLVRRARGVGIGARWARIQHGEVSEPLHAAHLCIRDGELPRQLHSRTWLFHQGLHRRRNYQSREPNRIGWFKHDAERNPPGILQDVGKRILRNFVTIMTV